MSLSKEERLKVIEEYVAAVNEVDKEGVKPTAAALKLCRMLNVNIRIISKDLKNLTTQDRLVLKEGLLWFKDVIL